MKKIIVCISIAASINLGFYSYSMQLWHMHSIKISLNRLLINAAKANNVIDVTFLLDSGAHVNTADESGNTPLMYAIQKNNSAMVRLLLQRAAGIYLENFQGQTGFTLAVAYHKPAIVRLLIEYNPEIINYQNSYERETALMMAVRVGNKVMVSMLLDLGANYELKNYRNQTALDIALSKQRLLCARYLVEAGAKVKPKDWRKRDCAFYAEHGHTTALAKLLNAGVGNFAIQNNDTTAVEKVEKFNSAFDRLRDLYGYGKIARQLKNDIIVKESDKRLYLKEYIQDPYYCALMYLWQVKHHLCKHSSLSGSNYYKQQQTHKRLKVENCSAHKRVKDTGQTLLMWACIFGHTRVVECLLSSELPLFFVTAQDIFGNTALTYACMFNRFDMAQALINYAVKNNSNPAASAQFVNIRNQQNRSALDYAAIYNQLPVITQLLACNAYISEHTLKAASDNDNQLCAAQLLLYKKTGVKLF